MAQTMQAHRCRSCEASSSIGQSLELSLAATSSQPVEPARRFGRGKLDRGWPEKLFVLAERAGTMACRGKLDRQVVLARSADLGDRFAIDLADSTFHVYRQRSQTISLSTSLHRTVCNDVLASSGPCLVSSVYIYIYIYIYINVYIYIQI